MVLPVMTSDFDFFGHRASGPLLPRCRYRWTSAAKVGDDLSIVLEDEQIPAAVGGSLTAEDRLSTSLLNLSTEATPPQVKAAWVDDDVVCRQVLSEILDTVCVVKKTTRNHRICSSREVRPPTSLETQV